MTRRKSARTLSIALAAVATAALFGCSAASSGSNSSASATDRGPITMNVLSFSGHLNDVNQVAAKGFEKKYNVKLNWTAGDPAGNVAKVLAGKNHQTYDIAFVDSKSQYVASLKGAWTKLDPKIVTNLKSTSKVGITPNGDGLGYGTYPTAIYYNADIFKQNGWPVPSTYDDVLDKRYCGKAGWLYVNDVYGVYATLSLGGDPKGKSLNQQFESGLKKLAAEKDCFPTFETSSGGLDQKILTDSYVVGIGGQARILPMQDSGKNIQFVVPKEGAFYVTSTVNIAVNAPHKQLAQEFVNWMASPQAETIQMEQSYYVPTNTTVAIPKKYADRGLVGGAKLNSLVRPFDLKTVNKELPQWVAEWEAIFSS
jgi:spermidine/putrescine-binding protein